MQTPCPPVRRVAGSSDYLFSWSWMNFPKRLLLLFLRVHAFPTDHTSVYTTPLCSQSSEGKVAAGLLGPSILKSPKGPFVSFHVPGDRTRERALRLPKM